MITAYIGSARKITKLRNNQNVICSKVLILSDVLKELGVKFGKWKVQLVSQAKMIDVDKMLDLEIREIAAKYELENRTLKFHCLPRYIELE